MHVSPDITHIKGNNDRKSAIVNLIKLKLFRANTYLKPHIFYTVLIVYTNAI